MTIATPRPRRSVLYMPAANARTLEKAQTLDADAFIFDLEDAVAPDAKEAARAQLHAALARFDYRGRERVVRVNGLGTRWAAEDLRMAAASGADAVLVPKVESPAMLREAEAALAAAGAPPDQALWAMMETPAAFLRADAIAGATPRLACLAMGTSDLAQELRAQHTPDRMALLPSLALGLLAARAHGLAALDGVHLDLADEAGFVAACRQALVMGFDGKTLIHPRTIAAANAVFAPAPERIAWAERVTAVHAEAEAAGQGIVLLDGKLIENLHVVEARRILATAAAIARSSAPSR
ncbi:CoA ester lyase [Stella sp.]|uniref:HpcH/HpaI aldolase/citrate lyase family protein n=1 Tax=Stella sp. TaxID=2912054 RepID=UPI0035B3CC26